MGSKWSPVQADGELARMLMAFPLWPTHFRNSVRSGATAFGDDLALILGWKPKNYSLC